MKIENKRKAQAMRAAAKKKKAMKKLLLKILGILLAVVIAGLLIWAIIIDIQKNKATSSSESQESGTQASTQEDTTTVELNKDTSLVVENGDKVNIDYVGTVDGVEFVGGNTKGNGADLLIGSKTYVDDFETQLIGHSVGESFEITVTFPDKYDDAQTVDGETVSLAGKDVVFAITINGIYK